MSTISTMAGFILYYIYKNLSLSEFPFLNAPLNQESLLYEVVLSWSEDTGGSIVGNVTLSVNNNEIFSEDTAQEDDTISGILPGSYISVMSTVHNPVDSGEICNYLVTTNVNGIYISNDTSTLIR